jgi:hypothetical protein
MSYWEVDTIVHVAQEAIPKGLIVCTTILICRSATQLFPVCFVIESCNVVFRGMQREKQALHDCVTR